MWLCTARGFELNIEWDYAGDGVYVGYDGFGLWLHANDHANPTDRVYLEPTVMEALVRIAKRKKVIYDAK